MARRFSPLAALLPVALALAACEPVSMVATGATFVSVIQSEETLSDKALSWATDQRCSIFQAARGEPYCQPVAPALPEQYCYRNLGGVTCYTRPDAHASSEVAVFAQPPKPAESPPRARPAPGPQPSGSMNRKPAH